MQKQKPQRLRSKDVRESPVKQQTVSPYDHHWEDNHLKIIKIGNDCNMSPSMLRNITKL